MRYFAPLYLVLILAGCSDHHPTATTSKTNHEREAESKPMPQSPAQKISPIENPDLNSPHVTLGDIPKVTLSPTPKPTHTVEQIEKLIASLASIESPDFGLSPTLSGQTFLPIEGKTNASPFLLTDHKIKSSDGLKQLVTIGSAALPSLLAHLDDATPTKLKVDHDGGFGGMWFANELRGNPVGKLEQAIFQARQPTKKDRHGDDVESYTVKVGDICLVAIGQITGRRYRAVRYQPTACIVINSPTRDPELCAQVRAIWQSDNPRQKLFDSLLLDYATLGKFNGISLDGWSVGSGLQVEAAMRLLYYYPTETSTLIADRLDHLNVARTGPPSSEPATEPELETFIQREVANGVRTNDFISAVVWSDHPDIVAAIKRIADRTNDADITELVAKAR